MNRIEKDINVTHYDIPERISYVQATNAIPLVFHIKDYDIPSGSTARVYVKRPDGTAEYDTASLSGNTVTVNVKKTMFAVVGNSRLQIRIANGDEVLVTFETIVEVRKNHAAGGVKSENATDIFDEALKDLDEATKVAVVKAGEAENSAVAAGKSETAAKTSETKSKASEQNALQSATDAEGYKNTAAQKAGEAATSAAAAAGSEQTATQKAGAASASAVNAANSADLATQKAEDAEDSADAADGFQKLSESYAHGNTGVRAGEDTDNSMFYSALAQQLTDEAQKLLEQAQKIIAAAVAGTLLPMGTVAFEDLPVSPDTGHMYNISNDFTTDSRFVEGAGVFYRAGANIYWTQDGKWDVLVGTQVTGVKGDAETEYRVNNVNLTKGNIGLGNVDNTADADKHVASAETITETLPISKGGTGKTNATDAANELINGLTVGDADPVDGDYYISQYAEGGTSIKTYHRRPVSKLWNYIKSKLATVATSGNYNDLSNKPTSLPANGGNAATAGKLMSYDTESTMDDKIGWWYKIAVLKINVNYGFAELHGFTFTTADAGYATYSLEYKARVKQQLPMGQKPVYSVRVLNSDGLIPADLRLIITSNTTSQTVGELWCKIGGFYMIHRNVFYNACNVEINTNMILQESLPAGDCVEGVSAGHVYAADKVVDYGNTEKAIQIGYGGPGVSPEKALAVAAYHDDGNKIKDLSFVSLKSILGIPNFPLSASGNRWGCTTFVQDDGCMEVGKYIDFHESDADTTDYSVRIQSGNRNLLIDGGNNPGEIATRPNYGTLSINDYVNSFVFTDVSIVGDNILVQVLNFGNRDIRFEAIHVELMIYDGSTFSNLVIVDPQRIIVTKMTKNKYISGFNKENSAMYTINDYSIDYYFNN